nr:ribonuclease H-like domain-containing protein [Tanacetum cinerariifolium]
MKNEMKARGTLLMALPNKDHLKFHSYKDAKLLMEAIEKRLQKLISQLEIQDIETISLDDLYNNLKIYEPGLTGSSSIIQNPQNVDFVSSNSTNSTSSTNEADTIAFGFNTAHSQDEQVESDSVDVVSNVASTDVKIVESKHESIDVQNKGVYNTIETKPVRKNNFSPPIIKDWNSNDESEVEFEPKVEVKTVRPSIEKIKFIKPAKEKVEKSGKLRTAGTPVNTVRPVNSADSKPIINYSRPISNAFKRGHSQVIRPYNKYSTYKKIIFNTMVNTVKVKDTTARERASGNPQQKEYKEKGLTDSGCSRHMTGKKCYLTDYEDYDGGFVSFGDGKCKISGKGKIKSRTLDFDDVYLCKELKYNMFSVSQMCDKKNNVLFTDTECLILSSNFKLLDESQVLLRVPRKDNIYSVDLKSVIPTGGLTCLFAKAIIDESNLWHMRLGHINYNTMNKLVRGNLNGVAERKNKTLIEAARTMLVDSKLPISFWAEAVNTTCYVLNRALVIKPHNKTPYELIRRRPPLIDFMKPFGWPVTILNTWDHLGKFDGKADEKFFVRYYVDSAIDAEKKANEVDESQVSYNDGQDDQVTRNAFERLLQQERRTKHINNTNCFNTVSLSVNTAGPSFANTASPSQINAAETPASTNAFEEHPFERLCPLYVPIVTPINDTGIFGNAYDDEVMEEEADINNVVSSYTIPDAPLTKFLKDHPKGQVIGSIETVYRQDK